MGSAQSQPRRTGRPRASGSAPDPEQAVEEILRSAGRLFGELGVAGTTMTRLAAEVGLRQSSLYYYFARKEQVVAALVERANVVPLGVLDRIIADGGPPAVRLHRFVQADTVALCELPFDINEIHRIAARDPEQFSDYWRERRSLQRRIAAIVREGVEDGSFRKVVPATTALLVMSNDEGVQNWFRTGSRTRPAAIGEAMADMVVGGLLADSTTLDVVRAEAEELDRRA